MGVEPPTKISKKRGGDLTGSQFLERVGGKEGGDLRGGGEGAGLVAVFT